MSSPDSPSRRAAVGVSRRAGTGPHRAPGSPRARASGGGGGQRKLTQGLPRPRSHEQTADTRAPQRGSDVIQDLAFPFGVVLSHRRLLSLSRGYRTPRFDCPSLSPRWRPGWLSSVYPRRRALTSAELFVPRRCPIRPGDRHSWTEWADDHGRTYRHRDAAPTGAQPSTTSAGPGRQGHGMSRPSMMASGGAGSRDEDIHRERAGDAVSGLGRAGEHAAADRTTRR